VFRQRTADSGQRARFAFAVCCLLSAVWSCHREQRDLTPPISAYARVVKASPNNPYEGNAYAISQGQKLFEQYNCAGCHFHGGGGIGPALMDDEWIYGSTPAKVYASITEGRPNGMPSFGGRIPADQVWKLVAYVRSLNNLEPPAAISPRADEMEAKR
jgi:cytochrome c oxidase cbb3-type subunit III